MRTTSNVPAMSNYEPTARKSTRRANDVVSLDGPEGTTNLLFFSLFALHAPPPFVSL